MVIWKFRISGSGFISLPKGARVLSFHSRHAEFYIWALIPKEPEDRGDPIEMSAQMENREFYLATTGSFIPDDFNGRFIGTAINQDGHVEHLFEAPRG